MLLDRVAPVLGNLEEALDAFEGIQDDVKELAAYYEDAVLGPVLPLVPEQPGHLQPDGVRVGRREGFVALAAHAGEIVGLPTLRNHLVEQVDAVDVVRPVDFRFLFHELFLDHGEERVHRVQEVRIVLQVEAGPVAHPLDLRIRVDPVQFRRDVTRESGQDGTHVQFPLPGDDLLLQFRLAVQPGHRQRAAPMVDVQHPVPGQVRGAGEISPDLFVGQAHFCPDPIPDGLLAGDGEGEVDALQGHPVDEMLPFAPLPPGHRVAVGAVVEEEAVLHPGLHFHGLGDLREFPGNVDPVPGEPAYVHEAVVLQVVVQAHRHRVRIVAFDDDAGALGTEAEHVRGSLRVAKLDFVGGFPEESVRQGRCGLRVGVVIPGCRGASGEEDGGGKNHKEGSGHGRSQVYLVAKVVSFGDICTDST